VDAEQVTRVINDWLTRVGATKRWGDDPSRLQVFRLVRTGQEKGKTRREVVSAITSLSPTQA
jgi:hypothetical protein